MPDEPSAEEIERTVAGAVRVFFRAYGTEAAAAREGASSQITSTGV